MAWVFDGNSAIMHVYMGEMSWQPWGQVGKCWIHSACGGPSLMKFWLQLGLFEPVKMGGSDFTQLDILSWKTAQKTWL